MKRVSKQLGFYLILMVFPSFAAQTLQGTGVINEFLASDTVPDASGNSFDWIEFFNSDLDSVNLAGYRLSDDKSDPNKWIFPSVEIPSKGYLVVYASGLDHRIPGEPLHTNFKLDREGEYLALRNSTGEVLDSFDPFIEQSSNISYGRYPDGADRLEFFEEPTPGEANRLPQEPVAPSPSLSPPGGWYPAGVTITLSTQELEGGEIRYCLDGSIPCSTSPLYSGPLQFDETTVIRAGVFLEGYQPSAVITSSYVICPDSPLPIMSLVTAPENLWDASWGIYVNAWEKGDEWERPVSVEYIETTGGRSFGVDAGMRMHGGASRKQSEKKSFRLYFRSEYGLSKLDYPLFPDTAVHQFDQLVLRGGYQGTWTHPLDEHRDNVNYINDPLVRNLFLDLGYVTAHSVPIRLYLNGRYWGLYHLSERIREDFLEDYFGGTEWDMIDIDGAKCGDMDAWQEFIHFYLSTDFSDPDNYALLGTRLDFVNFADYLVLNCWSQNQDWPQFNYIAIRQRQAEAKWQFIAWDTETTMGVTVTTEGYHVDLDPLARCLKPDPGYIYGPVGWLVRKTIISDEFKTLLWRRFQNALDTVLTQDSVMTHLEEQAELVRPAIADEAIRWATDKGIEDWEEGIENVRNFVRLRTPYIMEDWIELLGPPPTSEVSWRVY